MAKKTSRAERVQQNNRTQDTKREISARPIVGSNVITGANMGSGRTAVASEPFKMSISANDMADVSVSTPVEAPVKPAPVAPVVPAPRPVSATNNTVLPRRFLNAQPRQTQVISREEEYRYIRADLVTVFILAVLMVIALVVLTLLIGR